MRKMSEKIQLGWRPFQLAKSMFVDDSPDPAAILDGPVAAPMTMKTNYLKTALFFWALYLCQLS
jgi:hypothetical protein